MIGVSIGNRGAFLKLVTDAAKLDADIRGALRTMAGEYRRIAAAMLSSAGAGAFYGARTGRARYRVVRRRVTLFGGQVRTVKRRERMKGRNTRAYQGSAPGDPPAKFTGSLLRALRIAIPKRQKGYGAKVFSHKAIAWHRQLLEFGTGRYRIARGPRSKGDRAKTHMEPRPIWSPLQQRALAELERRVLRVIESSAAFRGVG